MDAVDFLHHENPPTFAGVKPATKPASDIPTTPPSRVASGDNISKKKAGSFCLCCRWDVPVGSVFASKVPKSAAGGENSGR
ncbi:hypothetical protein TNCV_369131 [Trichonephila clavipes]|nr:hypothetical protein TNCV_369131 [Trichonephila clavipes]